MAIIGYARVSSVGQTLDIQVEKLQTYGCERLFVEKRSGLEQARPQLEACLDYLREGDTFVVTRLDRLARSAIHLGTLVESFKQQAIDLVVLDQQIDTTQPVGKLLFHLLAGFAEFEWSIRKERQAEGIEKALRKGVPFGRPPRLIPEVMRQIQQQRQQGSSISQLVTTFNLGKTTIYRALKTVKE